MILGASRDRYRFRFRYRSAPAAPGSRTAIAAASLRFSPIIIASQNGIIPFPDLSFNVALEITIEILLFALLCKSLCSTAHVERRRLVERTKVSRRSLFLCLASYSIKQFRIVVFSLLFRIEIESRFVGTFVFLSFFFLPSSFLLQDSECWRKARIRWVSFELYFVRSKIVERFFLSTVKQGGIEKNEAVGVARP